MTIQERLNFTDKWARHVKRAIAYLKNAERGLYGVTFNDTPLVKLLSVDYWVLLDQTLDTALAIIERMPAEHFTTTHEQSLLDGESYPYNTSDGWLEKAQKIVVEIERRRRVGDLLRRIALLEQVEGRTPEEADAYQRKAAELRERVGA